MSQWWASPHISGIKVLVISFSTASVSAAFFCYCRDAFNPAAARATGAATNSEEAPADDDEYHSDRFFAESAGRKSLFDYF